MDEGEVLHPHKHFKCSGSILLRLLAEAVGYVDDAIASVSHTQHLLESLHLVKKMTGWITCFFSKLHWHLHMMYSKAA